MLRYQESNQPSQLKLYCAPTELRFHKNYPKIIQEIPSSKEVLELPEIQHFNILFFLKKKKENILGFAICTAFV